MAVNITKRSRLRFKEFLSVGGVEFWELDDLPSVPEQANDLYYRVRSGDRIDLLANTFYGDPNLWWVIAHANDLEVLPTNLVVDAVLRIPSPSYVQEVLFAKGTVQ